MKSIIFFCGVDHSPAIWVGETDGANRIADSLRRSHLISRPEDIDVMDVAGFTPETRRRAVKSIQHQLANLQASDVVHQLTCMAEWLAENTGSASPPALQSKHFDLLREMQAAPRKAWTMVDLSKTVSRDRGTVSSCVNDLQSHGLVSKGNGRGKIVITTDGQNFRTNPA